MSAIYVSLKQAVICYLNSLYLLRFDFISDSVKGILFLKQNTKTVWLIFQNKGNWIFNKKQQGTH